jgi:hypothetical protein
VRHLVRELRAGLAGSLDGTERPRLRGLPTQLGGYLLKKGERGLDSAARDGTLCLERGRAVREAAGGVPLLQGLVGDEDGEIGGDAVLSRSGDERRS